MVRVMSQLSVQMQNRPGALAELAELLVANNVNIVAILAAETVSEYGTIRLVPDDADAAKRALQEAGHSFIPVDVLVLELHHRPGALAHAARLLADHDIALHYAYASILTSAGAGVCVLRVDDMPRALELLQKDFATPGSRTDK